MRICSWMNGVRRARPVFASREHQRLLSRIDSAGLGDERLHNRFTPAKAYKGRSAHLSTRYRMAIV